MMSNRKTVKNIVFMALVLILALVILYSGLQILESTVFYNDSSQTTPQSYVSSTITRDGVNYFPRQDITVMMLLGIDQSGPVVSSGAATNDGLADVVLVVIFDEANEEYRIISLNRDTMVEIPILDEDGLARGSFTGQLALSHGYGSGLEDSCENTRKTVSDFLGGVTIHHYIAMNLDAISLLNDAVGGVTVTVTDDFSAVDPTLTLGEIKLNGEQAVRFVRSRRDVGDQLNLSRMERQKEYMASFVDAFRSASAADDSFVLSTYSDISPYIVTDCSVTVISSLMSRFADYTLASIVSPEGENVLTDHYEFYPDAEKLDSLIVSHFYAPK